MLQQHTFPGGHVEEPSVFWLLIQESLESGLHLLLILQSNGSILEVETVFQNRANEPGDGASWVSWKSLFGSKNVTYWMETHNLGNQMRK